MQTEDLWSQLSAKDDRSQREPEDGRGEVSMSSQRWLRNGIAATACALPLLFGGCAAPESAGVIAGTSTPTAALATKGPTEATPTTIAPTPTATPLEPTATPKPSPSPTVEAIPTPTVVEVSKAPQVDGLTLKLNAQTGVSEYFTPEGVYAGKFIPNAVKINQETAQRGVIAISNLKVAEQLTKNANKPEAVAQGGWKMIFPVIMDNKKSENSLEIIENSYQALYIR